MQISINERKKLKESKDFRGADAIRDSLLEKGIELIDSEDGTTWKGFDAMSTPAHFPFVQGE